jgi:hypothetical protein
MKINEQLQNMIDLETRVAKLQEKIELLNSEPMIDVILQAIIKVSKKQTSHDVVQFTKRYLRRYYNIDMDSKSVRDRIESITKQLKQ